IHRLTGHMGIIRCLTFDAQGKRLASASGDRAIKLWNAATAELERTIERDQASIIGVAFNPDGTRLASAVALGRVVVWDAATGRELSSVQRLGGPPICLAYAPDGRLAFGTFDRVVELADPTGG